MVHNIYIYIIYNTFNSKTFLSKASHLENWGGREQLGETDFNGGYWGYMEGPGSFYPDFEDFRKHLELWYEFDLKRTMV